MIGYEGSLFEARPGELALRHLIRTIVGPAEFDKVDFPSEPCTLRCDTITKRLIVLCMHVSTCLCRKAQFQCRHALCARFGQDKRQQIGNSSGDTPGEEVDIKHEHTEHLCHISVLGRIYWTNYTFIRLFIGSTTH